LCVFMLLVASVLLSVVALWTLIPYVHRSCCILNEKKNLGRLVRLENRVGSLGYSSFKLDYSFVEWLNGNDFAPCVRMYNISNSFL